MSECRRIFTFVAILWLVILPLELMGQPDSLPWPPKQVSIQGIPESHLVHQVERLVRQSPSEEKFKVQLEDWIANLRAQGRPGVDLENLSHKTNIFKLTFYWGALTLVDTLDLGGVNPVYANRSDLDRYNRKTLPLDWSLLEKRLAACLDIYQNDGYPFASFELDRLDYTPFGEDTLLATIGYRFDPGERVIVDSFRIQGDIRERPAFVWSLTKVWPGDRYSQKLINDMPRVLTNSIYYRQAEKPKVIFTDRRSAMLDLSLTRERAGKFDLLVGILPQRPGEKLQITGALDLVLVSPFRMGEIIEFQFEKLVATSQRVHLRAMVPYLFRLPLRLEADFNLLKQNEDFLNLNFAGLGWWEFSPFLAGNFTYRLRDTRLLDTDGITADTTGRLPPQLNGRRQTFGVGLVYENLDYRLNPTRGLYTSVEASLGNKIVREDTRLDPEIFNQIQLRQPVQEVSFSLRSYFPLGRRHVLHLANQTYWLGQVDYFNNDQAQIGGARSLRGFNENEFFADAYTFFTLEYRFVLERDSYIFAFGDQAWISDKVAQQQFSATGLGLGMAYGTKAGIISVIYAVGSALGDPFAASRGKIHVGLVNQF